ncbi:nucleoside hydrolase [Anaerosacchariphilus polymeriproducens]|uniref:Ribonucleoside hydrolase n=1 Tax=Anaerosacchariphilus polymeriproducens TaxID=1812858 RepID=A0A371ASN6_9FIRM|nr:nucleoside hydrolase [Anaerosacchariphilus polymeriproducens]RDU22587.1 ribonucleoside hydrolase [Anaerosacchariphilus polymeriproducens]
MEKKKIILDCDPGHDDAIAIMLAAKSKTIDLLGISIVAGNQTIDKTLKNALNVCQYLGLDVPVYPGCGQPMIRDKQVIAGDIHGESGLDGPVFEPLTKKAERKHGVDFLIETLLESDGDITVVTTGPMTNLGMAIRLCPDIVPKIKEIVLMGGCYQLGNVTPAAEFNIIADADAAHVAFTCGRKITMVGLDVTRKVLCYPEIMERMGKNENIASKLFIDLMTFFNKSQKEVYGWEGGPLHDPVTIAYLIDPTVLTVKEMFTQIDIRSEQSYGRTNCDFFHYTNNEPNSFVAIDIDTTKFWDIIEHGIREYN